MYYLGLDLGKQHDFTALAVVERLTQPRAWNRPPLDLGLRVRHLERMPLGTPYLEVAKRIRTITRNPKLQDQDIHLTVDATGLGNPVVEMLSSDGGVGCPLTAVTITSGSRANGTGFQWSVPKVDLMSGLSVLLQRRELKIARQMPETETLVKELISFQASQTTSTATHDDLVLALSLACWQANRDAAASIRSHQTGIIGTRRVL